METEKKFNVFNFLNEIKQDIEHEIKDQSLKTLCEVEQLIYIMVEYDHLVYYDYTRDVEIVAYLEDRVDILDLETNIKYEGNIADYLNKLAIAYLSEYLIMEMDTDNLE